MTPNWTLGALAQQLGLRLEGPPEWPVYALVAPEQATSSDLVILIEPKWHASIVASGAAAVVLPEGTDPEGLPAFRLWSQHPREDFARLLQLFYPDPPVMHQIHPSAQLDPDVNLQAPVEIGPGCVLQAGVSVGAGSRLGPYCVIESGAKLGAGVSLSAHVVVGARCILGDRVRVEAATVIGSSGYGYTFDGQQHQRIPQVGYVRIAEDVEIGAHVTIDRATLGETRIGAGTKIDNLVQIGHNVQIGERCLIVAQVGIAGSTQIGNDVVLAGQVGVAGHLQIGDQVVAAARSGITRDIAPGQKISGFPAQLHRKELRLQAALRRVPEWIQGDRLDA